MKEAPIVTNDDRGLLFSATRFTLLVKRYSNLLILASVLGEITGIVPDVHGRIVLEWDVRPSRFRAVLPRVIREENLDLGSRDDGHVVPLQHANDIGLLLAVRIKIQHCERIVPAEWTGNFAQLSNGWS